MPVVRDEARFFPQPRFVAMPDLRRLASGGAEVWVPRKNEWKRVGPLFLAVLDGLAAGRPFASVCDELPPVEGVRPKQARALARHVVWQLHKLGAVQLDLPEPPPLWESRYERARELGRGGLGVAHLCHDRVTGVDVVVKHAWGVLHPIARGQSAIAREAQALAALDHPGVPRLLATFVHGDLLHLVREYVDGEDLQRRFGGTRARDVGETRTVARHVAEVLSHAHDRGWLLLDLSPTNFLVRRDGRVVLIDLGTAVEHAAGRAALTAPVGSPGYVAPEVLRPLAGAERAATFATEVCSFGRLLFFVLAGRAPGRRETAHELVEALRASRVPESEVSLVAQCAADDPSSRPRTLRDVLHLLDR